MDRRTARATCDVLDDGAHRFATSNPRTPGAAKHFLWTVDTRAARKHDLVTGRSCSHDFGDGRTPGELVFVVDPNRGNAEDGGWLVGIVHDQTNEQAEFVVLDADAMDRPAVAKVPIAHRISSDPGHGIWISR